MAAPFRMPCSTTADASEFYLIYFPLMAKGLGPALVAQHSGLPWKGPKGLGFDRSHWANLKTSGDSPFAQLPLCDIDGIRIGQTCAIINYIGNKAKMNGGSGKAYAIDQMLLAEAEDIYTAMQKNVGTIYVPQDKKGGYAAYQTFIANTAHGHCLMLECLLGGLQGVSSHCRGAWVPSKSAGELYLFAALHQLVLCAPDVLNRTPKLKAWYDDLLRDPKTQMVLSGNSSFGPLEQYFIAPEESNPSKEMAVSLGLWIGVTLVFMQGWPKLM